MDTFDEFSSEFDRLQAFIGKLWGDEGVAMETADRSLEPVCARAIALYHLYSERGAQLDGTRWVFVTFGDLRKCLAKQHPEAFSDVELAQGHSSFPLCWGTANAEACRWLAKWVAQLPAQVRCLPDVDAHGDRSDLVEFHHRPAHVEILRSLDTHYDKGALTRTEIWADVEGNLRASGRKISSRSIGTSPRACQRIRK